MTMTTNHFSNPKQTPRKRPFVVITFVVTTFVYLSSIRQDINQLMGHTPQNISLASSNISSLVLPIVPTIDQSFWCDCLKSHSSGHWHQEYAPVNNDTFNSKDTMRHFFQDEMQWLHGMNIPSFGKTTCNNYRGLQSGKMYVTKLGNQVN